jgi:hypothetical protein
VFLEVTGERILDVGAYPGADGRSDGPAAADEGDRDRRPTPDPREVVHS